jgi:cytochrome c peroxidase
VPHSKRFNRAAARRGKALFNNKGRCQNCHMRPSFSDAGWNLHTGEEICIDNFQSNRSPTFRYRTTPLRGIVAKMKGGFYHDGRFPTLRAVVDHYDSCFKLGLSAREKQDLVEYLKGL